VLDLVKKIDEPVRVREGELAKKLCVSRTPVRHRDMVKTRTIERLNRARSSLAEHHAMIDAIETRDARLRSPSTSSLKGDLHG
jgi:DNA-binding GntR family transcriptional regulator